MNLRKRWYAIVLVAALLIAGAATLTTPWGGASAGQSGVFDDGKELLSQAEISVADAIAAAQTATSGNVGEVDLEYWDGKLVFNVDVGDKDVKVDAKTGKVLDATQED